MEHDAMITVRGGDAAYTVRGAAERRDDAFFLRYEEPAHLGMGRVTTTLALRGGSAVLTRAGAVRSELRFEPGVPHHSLYETPHGSFPAELETHALRAKLNAHGGVIELRYTLCLGGAADEHRLKLLVRTEEEL